MTKDGWQVLHGAETSPQRDFAQRAVGCQKQHTFSTSTMAGLVGAYRAVWTRERTGRNLLKDVAAKVYDGSVSSLVLQALSSSKASDEDIKKIRTILENMEARNNE